MVWLNMYLHFTATSRKFHLFSTESTVTEVCGARLIIRRMAKATIIAVIVLAGLSGACSRNRDAERERARQDQTAGEKAGRAAYWASKRAEKAIKGAARDLGKAAKQAHEGWSDAEREDRARRAKDQNNQK